MWFRDSPESPSALGALVLISSLKTRLWVVPGCADLCVGSCGTPRPHTGAL